MELIKSKNVCWSDEWFIGIGHGVYSIGGYVDRKGIRIMLIWWHLYFNWR